MSDCGPQVCMIYVLKPGMGGEYERRHREVWPSVVEAIRESGISDYSIFRRDDLVISVYRLNGQPTRKSQLGILSEWSDSLSPLFKEIADAQGHDLVASRVFRLDQ